MLFPWLALNPIVAEAVERNAIVKGVVMDEFGIEMPGAVVSLSSPDLIGVKSVTTDAMGRYRFGALPPGTYTIKVEKGEFEPWSSGELRVVVASTVQIDVRLVKEGELEQITVVDTSAAVDVEATQMGAVLDADFLKDIPVDRDWATATSVAPGVVGGGNANMHGGFDTANQFYVDGVNITDPLTNTFSANMNYDAIDSLQIITGGMDAEYGRSLGGAVNIVTKSGGNEFEGQASLQVSTPQMILAPTRRGDSLDQESAQQLALNLGGPIKKDLAWFYASLQGDRYITNTNVDPSIGRNLKRFPMQPRRWHSLYYFGKITVQPTPEHRLWVHGQGDPAKIKNAEQNPYTLPSGESIQTQGGGLVSLGHLYTPSDKTIVETQLYWQQTTLDYFSVLWEDCDNYGNLGQCTDDFVGTDYLGEPVTEGWYSWNGTEFNSGELSYASFNKRTRASVNSSLTHWFDAAGEHVFKTGFQAEMMLSKYAFPGFVSGDNYYQYDESLDETGQGINNLDAYVPVQVFRSDNNLDVRLGGRIYSAYVQDVYKPVERLTLRPGLRLDVTDLRNENQKNVFFAATLSPRFGAAFDLTGDNKTSLHAYYGRFYDNGFLSISDLLKRTSEGYSAFAWDDEAGDWSTEPEYSVAGQFKSHQLRPPYSDEFDIGISRDLGREVATDVTFVYEEARRFWEDDEVNLIWNADGTDVIGFRNDVNEAIFRLRTPDSVFTRYTSVEWSWRKAFADDWALLGSYVWSRAYGTNDSDQATGTLDLPEQRQYETGLLAYDRTHAFKLTGSWTPPGVVRIGRADGGFVIGWNARVFSGSPYRKLVWNDYYGGYANFVAANEGQFRLPWFSQIDLRAGFQLGSQEEDGPRTMLGIDLFNLLNTRTVTAVDTTFAPGPNNPFGRPLDRQAARRMQVLLRGEF